MDVQELDIQLVDQASLDFYDIISVQLKDGSEPPIWLKHSDHQIGESPAPSAKLVFTSEQPITTEHARQLQQKLRLRSERGWYPEIS